jgi:hypothetical protein
VNPLARLDRWFWAPVAAERLATLRLLTGAFAVVYLLVRWHVMVDFSRIDVSRFEPVGVTRVLEAPLPPAIVWALWAACVALGVAFTLGIRFRASGPAFALLLLWVTSYRNSWGMIFHNDNLIVVHALCLALAPSAAALALDARSAPVPADDGRFGWPVKLMAALTLATYVIAGVAKLRGAGLAWAEGDILRNYIAYDAMRKIQLGSLHSPFGAWIVQYDAPFPIVSTLTLALELGAPLALLGPRIALVIAAGLWSFHFGILVSMAIAFPYPLTGIGLAPLLPAERIWRWRGLSRLSSWLSGAGTARLNR